jgi:DNA-binding winged helix-turn-helix (wHTH) protein
VEQDRPFRLAIRFGDFEADLSAGKIYRLGARVTQKQPFQVLRTLLERPGDVITRAELRERIWMSDTFVDFECGLNKAINRIRGALSDSADNPMFIETVPGRGYRFVAPVDRTIISLAVLTLENLSGNPNQNYWAEGITDELISEVTKIVNLRVISRTSADRFKASRKSLTEISRDLGVDLVVQGSGIG